MNLYKLVSDIASDDNMINNYIIELTEMQVNLQDAGPKIIETSNFFNINFNNKV